MLRFIPILAFVSASLSAEDWPMFRGPNGTGVSPSRNLPVEFGPSKREIWHIAIPPGHSSPVLQGDRIYVTGEEADKLLTICLRRTDGKELWRRESPRPRRDKFDKRNNAASPSAAAEPGAVYVFFAEFGLVSYSPDGKERWRLPLGPFDNLYGMGASPVIADNMLILVCDQNRDSFAIGVDKNSGILRWKQPRKEAVSGHSTPVLYRPAKGPLQVIAPGSFRVDSYQADTGEVLWYANGLASEMKSVPVIHGDFVYINGFNLPENDPGKQVAVPEFAEMLKYDTNNDKRLSKTELPAGRAKTYFDYVDLDRDGAMNDWEWQMFRQSMAAENGLVAIRLGGKGDVSASHTVWKYHRSIPQLPSTVLYQDFLYMVNDGGILTVLEPATGKAVFQGRLRTSTDRVYASPVAADGKVYFVGESGAVIVRKAGPEHTVLAVNDLGEECYATPAIADGKIYIRTRKSLWVFGEK